MADPSHHFLNLIWLRGENEGAVLTTGRSRRRAGAGAWSIQMETARLSDQGQDVIFLTVGEQDLAAREPGIDAPDRGAFSRSWIEWGGCRVYWSGCGRPRDPHSPGVHARDAAAISPATIAPGETGYSSNVSRKAASVRRSVAPVTMPRRRTSRCLSRVRI
jgi:hypothetical protein